MADQDTETAHDAERSDLRQWQTLFQAFLTAGYSWCSAQEAVERISPGLGQAADAAVRRRTLRGEIPQAPRAVRR